MHSILLSMYTVRSTVCAQYTLQYVHSTLYSMYTVHCTACTQYTEQHGTYYTLLYAYSILYTVCTHYTVHYVHSTLYSIYIVHCTVCTHVHRIVCTSTLSQYITQYTVQYAISTSLFSMHRWQEGLNCREWGEGWKWSNNIVLCLRPVRAKRRN